MGFSIYGTGVSVLGYTRLEEDVYRVTLWITVLYLPILPVACRVVQPFQADESPLNGVFGDESFGFQILDRVPLHAKDVFRVYLLGWGLAAVAVTPIVVSAVYAKRHWPHGGLPWWMIAILVVCAAWPVVILGFINNRQHKIHWGVIVDDG